MFGCLGTVYEILLPLLKQIAFVTQTYGYGRVFEFRKTIFVNDSYVLYQLYGKVKYYNFLFHFED